VTLPFHLLRDHRLHLPNPSFGNPGWDDAEARILILRLSPFADVQRSTPHLFLFQEARSALPGAFIDMAFLPRPPDAALFTEAGVPLILGTQSRRALIDFDIVLVSNSWLLEQVNLPFLFSRSGVPLWASTRGEQWPPVILGGSNTTAAHALVSESGDCMADALFFGEGEGSVAAMVTMWKLGVASPKRERLAAIAAQVEGLWVAGGLPSSMTKARARDVRAPARAVTPVVPGPEAATARLSITIGCPCLCSFCFEGHGRKPYREIPVEEVLESARELKIATGASTLEIESFNFNTHAGIAALFEGLARLYHRVNFMSQRVDILARTPGLLDLEIAGDKLGFTLGVEGISGRLRRFLHKSLADGEIRSVLSAIHERKTREVKLFYMLTGRETEADIEEFAGFVKWLKQLRQRNTAAPRLVFSFGYMVRMPFTPLRHDPAVLDERACRALVGRVKSACETNGFEFRLSSSWPEYAATQALAAGGYSLHVLLQKMSEAGCITDTGLSEQAWHAVRRWLEENDAALGAEKPRDHPFPFGFLDDEGSSGFLYRQYERAKQGLDEGYALGRSSRPADTTGRLVREARALDELMDTKHRLKPVHVTARLPQETAGMGTPWIDAWLLRTYLAAHPAEADNVLSVSVPFAAGTALSADDVPWFGNTAADVIAWDVERLARSLAEAVGPLGAILPGFDPEAVKSVRVRVHLPAELFADPAQRLADFMRDVHAPVTLSGRGDTATFTAAEKSLKKKMLLAGTCRTTPAGAELSLTIGSRAFLKEWLESFGDTRTVRRALVEIL
jgi:hypothetical protein